MEHGGKCNAIASTTKTLEAKPHTNSYSKAKPGLDPTLPPFLIKKDNQKPRSRGDQETKYKECLKNHVVSTGGHVVDGCCEFMPGGEEGTLGAIKCAACGCHRSFHRKEVLYERINSTQELISPAFYRSGSLYKAMIQPRGVYHPNQNTNENGLRMRKEKRIRTKINEEQKEKMKEFAERLGWRMLKKDEEEIDKFCRLVNLRRQVFKVWVHNNKQAMKRRGNTCDLQK